MLDPSDWPLTCISHMAQFYLDNRMPIGSRMSSLNMQRIALFIFCALRAWDAISLIYLHDILLICLPQQDPNEVFTKARALVRRLGLPIAWDKIVSPSCVIKFLGVLIDCDSKEICLPHDKISAFLDLAREVCNKVYISKRDLQSLFGYVNHLGKAVLPA